MTRDADRPDPAAPLTRRRVLQGALAATGGLLVAGCAAKSDAASREGQPQASAKEKTSMSRDRMPTLYLPHGGGPCFFMDWTSGPADTWDGMEAWLRSVPGLIPRPPKAIVVASAHWEAEAFTVTAGDKNTLLYDYYGFPDHTYKLTWPAPAAPEVAARVEALIATAGLPAARDTSRGLDHGVFIPLKVAWPEPTIPTIQLSLRKGLDPAEHIALGRALAPLRDEGVLVIGSGMSFHNMKGFFRTGFGEPSQAFDDWLTETVALPAAERDARLSRWASAPSARACHPREEHLIPLMVIAGLAGDDVGEAPYRQRLPGVGVAVAGHVFGVSAA